MQDFTYSLQRSFNQYANANLGSDILTISGTTGTMILNWYPGHSQLDKDTICCHFYNEVPRGIGGGRWASGTKARRVDAWCQIDVWSPPNNQGEPRGGAHRKYQDRVQEAFKDTVRINLLQWDGTGGTTVNGGMLVQQVSAQQVPEEEKDGWLHTVLDYRVSAVDYD